MHTLSTGLSAKQYLSVFRSADLRACIQWFSACVLMMMTFLYTNIEYINSECVFVGNSDLIKLAHRFYKESKQRD